MKNVYGVDKQRALQDTVIGLATLPISGPAGGGLNAARAALQLEKAAAQAEAAALASAARGVANNTAHSAYQYELLKRDLLR